MASNLRRGFRLGPWKIEPLIGAISREEGDSRHLEPKVMDVFVCLAEHSNELVTREELLHSVWSGHAAADELLTGAISDLRRVLQDDPEDKQFIQTVPKRGYLLVGQVQALTEPGSEKQSLQRGLLWVVCGVLVAVLAVLTILNTGGIRD